MRTFLKANLSKVGQKIILALQILLFNLLVKFRIIALDNQHNIKF